jgi:apolipoprotein N-acyltransferase
VIRSGTIKPVTAVSAGLLHAVLMMLAFSPVGFWPAALVAILPLVWMVVKIERVLRCEGKGDSRWRARRQAIIATLLIALGVLPFYALQQHWLINVTAVGYVPMVMGMALFPAGFVWLSAQVRSRLPILPYSLVAPLIWTGLEVLHGEVAFSGYPWFMIAHPLIDAPLLPLAATLLGTYAVSFLVAMLSGVVADVLLLRPRRWAPGAIAAAAFVALPAVGALERPAIGEPWLRVAVVQTNVPVDNKVAWTIEQKLEDFERFLELTRTAAEASPHVIIWPETMFPGTLEPDAVAVERRAGVYIPIDPGIVPGGRIYSTDFYDRLLRFQAELGVPMLIGAIGVDGRRIVLERGQFAGIEDEGRFNSVYLVADGRVAMQQRYDKLVLTPFGEVMPYINLWPWLERQLLALGAHGMTFDLSPGREPRAITIDFPDHGPVAFGTPICFEVTKSHLTRLLLRDAGAKPRVLVNITNDGWFSHWNPARHQHLQISRWRSLELGVPMVRAANTGISASIDARGRVVRAGTDDGGVSRTDGVMTAQVAPGMDDTVFARFAGNSFAWLVFAGTGALLMIAFARSRTAG